MQHSVKNIGETHEGISTMRKDKYQFIAKEFFEFAKNNAKKYSIVENGDDLLVSTWYSNSLIEDYRNYIYKSRFYDVFYDMDGDMATATVRGKNKKKAIEEFNKIYGNLKIKIVQRLSWS